MNASRITLSLILVALSGVPAVAQYSPGDVILTNDYGTLARHVLGVKSTGKVYTATTALPCSGYSVTNAPDNRSLWVSGWGSGNVGLTCQVASDGTVTTLLPFLCCSMNVDGGGNMVATTPASGPVQIVRIGPQGIKPVLAGPLPLMFLGGAIDLGSGDLVAEEKGSGEISFAARVTLRGPATVKYLVRLWKASLPWYRFSFHHDPETGDLLGTSRGNFFRLTISPNAGLTTIASVPWLLYDLDRDPSDGRFVFPAFGGGTTGSVVMRMDARTSSMTTMARLPAQCRPAAAAIAGSRHLCGLSDARPGSSYTLLVSSPNEPGARYMVALSLGFRPGIPVGSGRKVYLNPDPLFLASVTGGGPFYGFQGTLDGRGEAVAVVAIPNLAGLSGNRFFASAITIVNNQISVISDPLGATIQ